MNGPICPLSRRGTLATVTPRRGTGGEQYVHANEIENLVPIAALSIGLLATAFWSIRSSLTNR